MCTMICPIIALVLVNLQPTPNSVRARLSCLVIPLSCSHSVMYLEKGTLFVIVLSFIYNLIPFPEDTVLYIKQLTK